MASLLMDRPTMSGMHSPSMSAASHSAQSQSRSAASPGFLSVPQCTISCERCDGGCRISCRSSDEVACATLQYLCRALATGCCTVSCTKNGICLMECNLAMCNCRCECTSDGVSISCTSGDRECCAILQACCDSICACLKAGCCCTVSFNGTPVCCGCC